MNLRLPIILKLTLLLVFAFFLVLIPHIDYHLPVHIDEWNHLAYTQAIIDNGNIYIRGPYYGLHYETSLETGYYLFIGILHEITGIQWFSMPVFLPGIIFILTVLAVYCFARRLGFGFAAAFLTSLIPTSVGLLGPAFMVPAALGLLFIALTLLSVFYLRGFGLYILVFIYMAFLFLSHSPTAICIIILLIPFIIVNFKVNLRHSLFIILVLFAPLLVSLPLLLPIIKNTLAHLNLAQSFPDYVGFPALLKDYGYIPIALSFIGVIFLVIKRGVNGFALVVGLFLLLIMLVIFLHLSYGVDVLYLRGLLYMLLLLSIVGGAGLLWIKDLTIHKVKAGHIIVAPLVIVILAMSLPAHFNTPYYHMIDRNDFRAFSWIRDNVPENNGKALVDPWKATAFTAVTRKNIYHRIFQYREPVDDRIDEFLNNACRDTNFITDNNISIVYNDITCDNYELIHIYNNVYIFSNEYPVSSDNLLKNPGFSSFYNKVNPVSWTQWYEDVEPVFTYPDDGLYGGPCISIEIPYAGSSDQLSSAIWFQDVEVRSGISYYIGGWIKTEDIVGQAGAMIIPHWKGADNSWIGTSNFMNYVKWTNDWQYFEGVVTAPEGASSCTFCCLITDCFGKAWFDDMVFRESQ